MEKNILYYFLHVKLIFIIYNYLVFWVFSQFIEYKQRIELKNLLFQGCQ